MQWQVPDLKAEMDYGVYAESSAREGYFLVLMKGNGKENGAAVMKRERIMRFMAVSLPRVRDHRVLR